MSDGKGTWKETLIAPPSPMHRTSFSAEMSRKLLLARLPTPPPAPCLPLGVLPVPPSRSTQAARPATLTHRLLPAPSPQLPGESPSKATHEALRDSRVTLMGSPLWGPPSRTFSVAAVGHCGADGSGKAAISQAAPLQHRVRFSPPACLSACTQKHDSIIISLNLLFEMALGFNAFSILLCHLKSIHKTLYTYYLN